MELSDAQIKIFEQDFLACADDSGLVSATQVPVLLCRQLGREPSPAEVAEFMSGAETCENGSITLRRYLNCVYGPGWCVKRTRPRFVTGVPEEEDEEEPDVFRCNCARRAFKEVYETVRARQKANEDEEDEEGDEGDDEDEEDENMWGCEGSFDPVQSVNVDEHLDGILARIFANMDSDGVLRASTWVNEFRATSPLLGRWNHKGRCVEDRSPEGKFSAFILSELLNSDVLEGYVPRDSILLQEEIDRREAQQYEQQCEQQRSNRGNDSEE